MDEENYKLTQVYSEWWETRASFIYGHNTDWSQLYIQWCGVTKNGAPLTDLYNDARPINAWEINSFSEDTSGRFDDLLFQAGTWQTITLYVDPIV